MGKILLIEDDHFIRLAVERYIRSAGHEVLTAENGKVGLETARENHPDLILLDMMMPVMSGMEFLKEFRGGQPGADPPIIALTSIAERNFVVKALESGIQDYVVKPISPKTLLLKVQKLLGKSGSRSRRKAKKVSHK